MNFRPVCVAVLLCLLASAASAAPNFTYVSLGYGSDKVERNGANCTQGGIQLSISVPLNEWYYAVASHDDQTSNNWCGITKTQGGLGMHYEFGAQSSVYGHATAILANYPWDEYLGAGFTAGLRTIPILGTEVKGFMTYETIDGKDVTFLGAGVNMWMNKDFSGFCDLAFGSSSQHRISIGVRYNF